MKRVLFVIRGKLGDTLASYASVRAFADSHPDWDVALVVRSDYARLLEGERGLRLLPFGSRLELAARLLADRLAGHEYDALCSLWAFGAAVRWTARLVKAKRRIHFRAGHEDLYPERPSYSPDHDLFEPAWQVARMIADDFPKPSRLHIPALAQLREAARRDPETVGVVPAADELRKNFDPRSLESLLAALARRHPAARFRVFVNPRDRGSGELLAAPLPERADWRSFTDLRSLLADYAGLAAWYGTDTGLYHLAAAMGIPATVFFGPTQPWKIIAPEQPGTHAVRISALGRAHCEEKRCARPLCLHQGVASYAGAAAATLISDTPESCPLRAHASSALVAIDEDPRR